MIAGTGVIEFLCMKRQIDQIKSVLQKIAEIRMAHKTQKSAAAEARQWPQLIQLLGKAELLVLQKQQDYLSKEQLKPTLQWELTRNYLLVIIREMEKLTLLLGAYDFQDHHPQTVKNILKAYLDDVDTRVNVIYEVAVKDLNDPSSLLAIRHELGQLDNTLFEISRMMGRNTATP